MQRPDFCSLHQAVGCSCSCSSSCSCCHHQGPSKAIPSSSSSSSSNCDALATLVSGTTAVVGIVEESDARAARYFLHQVLSISRLNEQAIRLFQAGRLEEASQLFSQALRQLPTGANGSSNSCSDMCTLESNDTVCVVADRGRSSLLRATLSSSARMPTISLPPTPTGDSQIRRSQQHHHHQQQHQYSFTRREYDEGMQVFSSCMHIDTTAALLVPSLSHKAHHDNTLNYMAAILLFNKGLTHMTRASCSSTSSSCPTNKTTTSSPILLAVECFLQAVHTARRSCTAPRTNVSSSGQHVIVASLHNIGYIQFLFHGKILQAIATFHEALQECCFHDDDMDESSSSSSSSSSSPCCCSDNQQQHHLHHHYHHLAATLNCLGVLYYHLPRCETTKALEYLQQSLSIQRRHHSLGCGSGSSSQQHDSGVVLLATTLNNIGRVLYMSGKFDQAMVAYNEALDIRRAVLGNMHLDVAATLYNIGQTHHQTGNLHQALEQYQEFMVITVPQLGHCHRDVATILKCMAQIHQDGKQYQQALCLFQQALCAARGCTGGGSGGGSTMQHNAASVLVASICNKIGNLYYEMGDYRQAIQMYQQGLEIERVVLDAHHPNIMVTLSNIGQIYKECGDLNAAALVYQQVLDLQLQQRSLPRNDACLAITYSNLGLIHYQNRNHLAALEMYQEALRIRRQVYGDDEENLEVAATLNSIGLVLFKLGLFELAIQSFSEGLRMRRQALGDSHRDVAIILYNIATVHLELGAEDDAMSCYQQALQVEIKALGPNHLDLILTLRHISQVHQQRGEIAQAMDTCLEILRIQKANFRHDVLPATEIHHQRHHNVSASASDMVQTYNGLANLRLQSGDGAGVVEAMAEATRIARRAGLVRDENGDVIHLVGFHMYGISKLHPEAAASA